MNKVYL